MTGNRDSRPFDEQAFASYLNRAYRKGMPEGKKTDLENPAHILDDEDEETLAIEQRVKSADQGRLVTSEKVRKQMNKWLAKASTTERL